MNFRDFVEQTIDAVQTVAFSNLQGDRDITPMLHLESDLGIGVYPIDAEFFKSSESVQVLVERYIVPLVNQDHARKVALTFCGWMAPVTTEYEGLPLAYSERPSAHPDRREVLLATFIDGEVIEHWAARLIRTGGPIVLGPWQAAEANIPSGLLTTTIQEALR